MMKAKKTSGRSAFLYCSHFPKGENDDVGGENRILSREKYTQLQFNLHAKYTNRGKKHKIAEKRQWS